MQYEVSPLDVPAIQAENPLWMNRVEAQSFAVLRRRVNRVPRALEYCRNVFGRIFVEFYPLTAVPSSLEQLCRVFSQPVELRRVVDHQIRSGARYAFALVHSHWPGIELMTMARGLLVGVMSRWRSIMKLPMNLRD